MNEQDTVLLQASVLDYMHDAVTAVNERLVFIAFNRAAEKLYGWKASEVLGRYVYDVIPSDTTPAQRDEIMRALAETGHCHVEVVHYRKDGRPVQVEGNIVALHGTRGQIRGYVSVLRDVTQYRRAEKALRESEARYRSLVEVSPDAIVLTDLKANVLMVNSRAVALFGYGSASEIIGKNAFDFIVEADQSRALNNLRRTLETGSVRDVEYTVLKKDGTRFSVELSASLIVGPHGEPQAFTAVVRDITERKQAEEALRASQERLQYVLASSPAVIYLLKIEGDAFLPIWVSENITPIMGYEPQETLAPQWWVEHLHPEDRERVLGEQALPFPNDRLLRKYRLRHKDGSYRWIRDETRLLRGADGRPVEAIGSWSDITEHKRMEEALRVSEKRFRALIENSSDGIVLLNAEGDSLYVSPSTSRILGYTSEELVGAGIRLDLVHPDDVQSARAVMTELVQHPGKIVTAQYRFRHKDGSWRWLEATASNQLDEPSVGAIVSNFRDITEHKRAEDEVRRQASRAEALAQTAARLNAERDLDAVMQAACEETARALNVPIAVVYLLDEQRDLLCYAAGFGLPREHGRRVRPLPRAAYDDMRRRQGAVTVIPDVQALPDLPNHDLSHELDARTVATAAIQREGQLIGFLGISTIGAVRQFTSDELSLLEGLAHQAALATVKAQLFEEARDSHARLQSLSRQLLQAQEAERRHIARELHDEIGQTLTGLKLLVDMSMRAPAPSISFEVAEAQALLNDLLDRVHNLSLDLRPAMLDDLGLLPALLSHFERYTAQTGVQARLEHTGLDRRFPPEVETAAYRIVQEALTNVARHAHTHAVTVHLWASTDRLWAHIEDRGTGFDADAVLAARTASGLAGMRERALLLGGQLTIESAPGAGALVLAELPLAGRPNGENRPV